WLARKGRHRQERREPGRIAKHHFVNDLGELFGFGWILANMRQRARLFGKLLVDLPCANEGVLSKTL
ncbi:hypothetical protein ACC695_41105, partial [Rhizobium ruizarguesonis]